MGFAIVVLLVVVGVKRLERVMRLSATLVRLQDTTAEIRVRAAVLLLIGFVALAEKLGLETILAAFLAGATLRLIDQDQFRTHPNFRVKLEAIGYGFLIPVFFVTSGLQVDVRALFASPSNLFRLPIFVVALLLVRGLPALPYRSVIGSGRVIPAGLLQATSLPFIVAATAIGVELRIDQARDRRGARRCRLDFGGRFSADRAGPAGPYLPSPPGRGRGGGD